jgi:SAM-dependent methyltransferase
MSPGGEAVTGPDPDGDAGRLASEALSAGDPTGWFERLYAAAESGSAVVPWDRGAPHWLLTAWAEARALDGAGRRALVVGCGLGADAEYLAGLGFAVAAFDISASAIRTVRRRFPGSPVDYQVADLLDLPARWREAFDLVVESQTVQALPDPPRRRAIARAGRPVAPGGTLVVIARAATAGEPVPGPPWPLTRDEVDAFAEPGLVPVRIDNVDGTGRQPPGWRWLAEFRRPDARAGSGFRPG